MGAKMCGGGGMVRVILGCGGGGGCGRGRAIWGKLWFSFGISGLGGGLGTRL